MPSRAIVARVPAGGAAPAAGVPLLPSVALALVLVLVLAAVCDASASSPAISVDTADSIVDAAVDASEQMAGAKNLTATRSELLQLLVPRRMHAPNCAANAEAPLPVALRQTHVRSVATQPRSTEARAKQARAQDGTWAMRSGRGVAVVGAVVVVVGGVDVCKDVVWSDGVVDAAKTAGAKRTGMESLILRMVGDKKQVKKGVDESMLKCSRVGESN